MLQHYGKNRILDYGMIILGSFIIGYAIKNVIDPVRMVTGGVSGFAVIFNALFAIPLWVTNTVLNIPLFIRPIMNQRPLMFSESNHGRDIRTYLIRHRTNILTYNTISKCRFTYFYFSSNQDIKLRLVETNPKQQQLIQYPLVIRSQITSLNKFARTI